MTRFVPVCPACTQTRDGRALLEIVDAMRTLHITGDNLFERIRHGPAGCARQHLNFVDRMLAVVESRPECGCSAMHGGGK